MSTRRFAAASMTVLLPFVLTIAACSPAAPTDQPPTPEPTAAPPTPPPPTPIPSDSPAPTAATGFVFDAESVLGYYASLGYDCSEPQPSSQAADHDFRGCTLVDADGRTRSIGIVTDQADEIAEAYASIQGRPGETILEPSTVLEPFAAFLGAMLGREQGEALLPWLAGHLGDDFETTVIGDLIVATYIESPEDHSTLYLEIATQAYLDAPTPGPTQ